MCKSIPRPLPKSLTNPAIARLEHVQENDPGLLLHNLQFLNNLAFQIRQEQNYRKIALVALLIMVLHVLFFTESLVLTFYATVLSLCCVRYNTILFTSSYIMVYVVLPIFTHYSLYLYDAFGFAENYKPSLGMLIVTTLSSIGTVALATGF